MRPGEVRVLRLVADSERRTPTEVDLWYPGTDRMGISVRGPDGQVEVTARPGEHASIFLDGRELGRLYHRTDDPNNGDCQVTLMLYASAPPARWEIELRGDDVADGRYHAWVERDPICARCQAHFVEADSEVTGTTGTICNGLRTIAVGAFNAHRQERPLGRFSSCGPTRDGRQKPDLIAPGVRVLSARSSRRPGKPGAPLLTRMSGTSMAAPHVAGAICLMFEAAGRPLAIDETRRIVLGLAEEISPDADLVTRLRTGSGMLDTSAAVAAARKLHPSCATTRTPIMSDENEAENAENTRERKKRRTSDRAAPLPFQVQVPLTGGSPALAMPLGGAGSPIAMTVPLGGQPAAPAPAPVAAAPAPVAAAPAAAAPAAAAPAAAAPPAPLPPDDPVAALKTDVQFYVPPEHAEWAESAPPGSRTMIRRGSRGPGVVEAQQKLNQVHLRRTNTGLPGLDAAPLVEDGAFGELTHRATVSFQRLAFPNQPNEWDGVIGPKTWAMLDAMAAGPVPVPPTPPTIQPDDPPILPVSDEGCGNLTVWINAFIPRDVPNYTITIPMGPHRGKTAVPCPWQATPANPNCGRLAYLTDQRGFSKAPSASVRMRSVAEISLVPPGLVRDKHETSGTIEVNKFLGLETCNQNANMSKCRFSNFNVAHSMNPPGSYTISLDYTGAASDPCVNLAADIDYKGTIRIFCNPVRQSVEVSVSGFVDAFPAFEMYASLGGTTHTLFTLAPPPGNTVIDLLGGASTPVAGRAQFACTFGQPLPMPGTAFTASETQEASEETAATEAFTEAYMRAFNEAYEQAENGTLETFAEAEPEFAGGGEAIELAEAAECMGECSCGNKRVERADALALSPGMAPADAAAFIEALLGEGEEGGFGESEEGNQVQTLERPSIQRRELAPAALFNTLAVGHGDPHRLASRFDVIARPGEPLRGVVPRAGDLMVRVARGQNWGNVGVVASNGLHALNRLGAMGLKPEGLQQQPGSYLHVVELAPVPSPVAAGLARRLAGEDTMVLPDTLLLRPRTTVPGGEAESFDEQFSGPLCDTLSAFERDSDTLLPVHRGQIQLAARNIISRGITSVAITGFASSDGSREYNQALGMRRAERVAAQLRVEMEAIRRGSSSIAMNIQSRGEDEQIAGGAVTLNRRVTVCPSAPPRPRPEPPTLRTKVFRVTAKSFIARIGSNVGSLSCGLNTRWGHIPSPATNPALRAFAAVTDVAFSENPRTDGIFVTPPPDNKGYRLFSSSRIQVEHRGTQLISASVVGSLLTDAGKECVPGVGACLQAPPLVVDIAPTFTRIDASRMRVTWGVRGRPPTATEPAFAAICIRTCFFIWHRIKATIDCSSGVPVFTSLVVEGSRFPSHRLWLDGAIVHNVPQGPLSGLWDAEPGDPTRVH
jgi:outer membrane protein OmpA-like peptidoglycan-associated protein